LQFEEKPDYNYLRTLLKTVFDRYSYEWDFKYDWLSIKKPENEEQATSDKKDGMG
jgi:hypothetical protein